MFDMAESVVQAVAADRFEAALEVLGTVDEPLTFLLQPDEDLDLRPQHPGVERLRQEVDGARGVAPIGLVRLTVDGGEEDDGDVVRWRPALDVSRGLVAVHLRHLDVEQYEGHALDEKVLESLLAARGRDQLVPQVPEDGFQGQQVLGAIVDQQDASGGRGPHAPPPTGGAAALASK